MEQVLICSTQTAPTVPYIEDLLGHPMDLSFTIDSQETVWWPDHSMFTITIAKGKEQPFPEAVNSVEQLINHAWRNWFAERASAKNILTLYSFVKVWNAVYPQHHISSVVTTLESNKLMMKEEGEGLQVIIDQILQKISIKESYSLKDLMVYLLEFISEHFPEFYQEYEFDLIQPNDRPDSSIFSEDYHWANRLIVQVYLTQSYTTLMDCFDAIYIDGELIPPSQHRSVAMNDTIKYCTSVTVYSN